MLNLFRNTTILFCTISLLFGCVSLAQTQTADNFFGLDTAGKPVFLYQQKSKNIVLVFWSAECESCIEILTELNGLNDIYNKRKLQVVTCGISLDFTEWKNKVKELNLKGVNIICPESHLASILSAYQLEWLPTFFLLNRKKEIVKRTSHLSEILKSINNEMK